MCSTHNTVCEDGDRVFGGAGWSWFSLCNCIQINLIWSTMLRPDTSGLWMFSWLIGLPRGRDHVGEICKRTLSYSVQQDQTCLIAELTWGFEKCTWTCLIFVECCHNSDFDCVWSKATNAWSRVHSSVHPEIYCKTDICCPFWRIGTETGTTTYLSLSQLVHIYSPALQQILNSRLIRSSCLQ